MERADRSDISRGASLSQHVAPSQRADSDGVGAEGASSAGDVAAAIRSYLSVLETGDESHQSATNENLTLEEVARIVSREQNADRLIAACLKKTVTFLDLDIARLYRIDAAGASVTLAGSHGRASEAAEGDGLARNLETIRKNSRHHRGPVTVEEVVASRDTVAGTRVTISVVSVPILDGAALWGVFQAGVESPRRFTPSEMRVIESVAGLVGLGLQRIDDAERCATLRATAERKSARIVDLYHRLRDVRADLQSKNRSLAEAYGNLKEVEKMKDAFVSSISHEMRTPLTIIRSYLDLLLNYTPDSRDKEIEFLQVVDNEAVKLINQINKILHLTEIRGNEVRLEIGRHPVEEISQSVFDAIAHASKEKEIRIERRIASGLPNLLVDRAKAIQILSDILDNAVKFSPVGASVTFGAKESPRDLSGASVTFWIADNGPGIESEYQTKIFEQFSQIADEATGKPRGIGLGLPICKAYVERMGGKVWLESEHGSGSTFFVCLPAVSTPSGA